MNYSPYSGRNIGFGRACREAYTTESASMPEQLYRVTLIDGTTIDGLTHEEATAYFYSHAGSTVKPWPVTEYRAP